MSGSDTSNSFPQKVSNILQTAKGSFSNTLQEERSATAPNWTSVPQENVTLLNSLLNYIPGNNP